MSPATLRVETVGARLHLRWCCSDQQLWRAMLDSFKTRFPRHSDRCYHPSSKCWSVPSSHRARLEVWARAWVPWHRQTWDTDPATGDDSAGADEQAGEPLYELAPVAAAFATLHLLPSAPAAVVTAAHRAMVRLSHPDAGGSHEAAVIVNRAMEIIRENRRAG